MLRPNRPPVRGLRRTALIASLALLCAAPAPAQAANSCRSASTARGTQIVMASKGAVVYHVAKSNEDVACTYKHKRRVKLENIACCSVLRYTLGGRYLAYAYRLDEADNEVDELGVVDLATGKRLKYGGARRVSTYGYMRSFFVTSKGTLAWSQVEEDDSGKVTKRSIRAATPGGKNRELDAGDDIDTASLALSSNGKTLFWTKGGVVQHSAVG